MTSGYQCQHVKYKHRDFLCKNIERAVIPLVTYSAIHKAAVQRSAGSWNDPQRPFQPLVPLTASGMELWNDGIVPIKSWNSRQP